MPFSASYAPIGQLDTRNADLELGLADYALVVIANRYKTNRIVSFDERHFRQRDFSFLAGPYPTADVMRKGKVHAPGDQQRGLRLELSPVSSRRRYATNAAGCLDYRGATRWPMTMRATRWASARGRSPKLPARGRDASREFQRLPSPRLRALG
jgi:hypothetical protein